MPASQKITTLYAWIASDGSGQRQSATRNRPEAGEGIASSRIVLNGKPHMMPLIGADMARMVSLRPLVEAIKADTGVKMRLCRFQLVDELEVI